MRRCLLLLISFVLFSSVSVTQAQQSQPSPPGLSFEFYRAHVEPIFLARRAGHARCYACHALGAGEGNAPAAMRLEILSPGSTTWTEEQSRKNFDAIRKKVFANNPFSSPPDPSAAVRGRRRPMAWRRRTIHVSQRSRMADDRSMGSGKERGR